MALVPRVIDKDWVERPWNHWDDDPSYDKWFNKYDRLLDRPWRYWDTHFNDFWSPALSRFQRIRPWHASDNYDVPSKIVEDQDKFEVTLDVHDFKPHEISIKTSGNKTIIIEGEHEEQKGKNNVFNRKFIKRFVLPSGHDLNNAASHLSTDGILTIVAPKYYTYNAAYTRRIPIQHSGTSSKAIEWKKY